MRGRTGASGEAGLTALRGARRRRAGVARSGVWCVERRWLASVAVDLASSRTCASSQLQDSINVLQVLHLCPRINQQAGDACVRSGRWMRSCVPTPVAGCVVVACRK